MGALLGHIDMMPLLYGVIMFLGVWSMWAKLCSGQIFSFIIEAAVFFGLFSLHGGTMAGGFAAMVAALIAGRVLGRRKVT